MKRKLIWRVLALTLAALLACTGAAGYATEQSNETDDSAPAYVQLDQNADGSASAILGGGGGTTVTFDLTNANLSEDSPLNGFILDFDSDTALVLAHSTETLTNADSRERDTNINAEMQNYIHLNILTNMASYIISHANELNNDYMNALTNGTDGGTDDTPKDKSHVDPDEQSTPSKPDAVKKDIDQYSFGSTNGDATSIGKTSAPILCYKVTFNLPQYDDFDGSYAIQEHASAQYTAGTMSAGFEAIDPYSPVVQGYSVNTNVSVTIGNADYDLYEIAKILQFEERGELDIVTERERVAQLSQEAGDYVNLPNDEDGAKTHPSGALLLAGDFAGAKVEVGNASALVNLATNLELTVNVGCEVIRPDALKMGECFACKKEVVATMAYPCKCSYDHMLCGNCRSQSAIDMHGPAECKTEEHYKCTIEQHYCDPANDGCGNTYSCDKYNSHVPCAMCGKPWCNKSGGSHQTPPCGNMAHRACYIESYVASDHKKCDQCDRFLCDGHTHETIITCPACEQRTDSADAHLMPCGHYSCQIEMDSNHEPLPCGAQSHGYFCQIPNGEWPNHALMPCQVMAHGYACALSPDAQAGHALCEDCAKPLCNGKQHHYGMCKCPGCGSTETIHAMYTCGHYGCENTPTGAHGRLPCWTHKYCEIQESEWVNHELCELCNQPLCEGEHGADKCGCGGCGSAETIHARQACGHYACQSGDHYELACGHYACQSGDHYELACGHYACQSGNHYILNCGHYACQGGNHYTLNCGHYACQSGNHYTLSCGHYACQGGNHYTLNCGHYACQGGNHYTLNCGHYACQGGNHALITSCALHYACQPDAADKKHTTELPCGHYECDTTTNHEGLPCEMHGYSCQIPENQLVLHLLCEFCEEPMCKGGSHGAGMCVCGGCGSKETIHAKQACDHYQCQIEPGSDHSLCDGATGCGGYRCDGKSHVGLSCDHCQQAEGDHTQCLLCDTFLCYGGTHGEGICDAISIE